MEAKNGDRATVCEKCNARYSAEELVNRKRFGLLECPTCSCACCSACMPFGRGTECMDCDDANKSSDSD